MISLHGRGAGSGAEESHNTSVTTPSVHYPQMGEHRNVIFLKRVLAYNFTMQHLSEEERGRVELQLLNALQEALDQFEQATLSQREAARIRYLKAIENYTHFVAQSPHRHSGGKTRHQVA